MYILHAVIFFTQAKFDANNGLFKENLVKYKGKRTSQDVMFIVFLCLSERKIGVLILKYPLLTKKFAFRLSYNCLPYFCQTPPKI